MAVTYLIKFQVVQGRRGQFLKLLEGVLDAMRHESTFHEAMLQPRSSIRNITSCSTRHGRVTRTS